MTQTALRAGDRRQVAPPFRLLIPPEDAFLHAAWKRARAGCLDALRAGRNAALLGAAGTGKSLLLRELVRSLRAEGQEVRLLDPSEAVPPGDGVLLIDDADRLPEPLLASLLQDRGGMVLAGLPGFAARIQDAPGPPALVPLDPLVPEEVARFVAASVARLEGQHPMPSPEAVLALARWSGGAMRLVTSLASAATFLAEQEDAHRVLPQHVEEAAELRGLAAPAQPLRAPARAAFEPGRGQTQATPAPGQAPAQATPEPGRALARDPAGEAGTRPAARPEPVREQPRDRSDPLGTQRSDGPELARTQLVDEPGLAAALPNRRSGQPGTRPTNLPDPPRARSVDRPKAPGARFALPPEPVRTPPTDPSDTTRTPPATLRKLPEARRGDLPEPTRGEAPARREAASRTAPAAQDAAPAERIEMAPRLASPAQRARERGKRRRRLLLIVALDLLGLLAIGLAVTWYRARPAEHGARAEHAGAPPRQEAPAPASAGREMPALAATSGPAPAADPASGPPRIPAAVPGQPRIPVTTQGRAQAPAAPSGPAQPSATAPGQAQGPATAPGQAPAAAPAQVPGPATVRAATAAPQAAATLPLPPPLPPAPPEAEASFRGPITNLTLNRSGQLALTVLRHASAGEVTLRFHASGGLIGTGELSGTISSRGEIIASGQLMMGQNAFDCVLGARLFDDRITGSATFNRSGQSDRSRTVSAFSLARAP